MSRVLIIEDKSELADLFCIALRQRGYDCVSETDALAGLGRAMADDYDLIILDLMMPEMNGFDVAQKIREGGSRIPILMVTGRTGDPLLRGSARRAGIDRIMEKPVEMVQLYECVACLTNGCGAGCEEVSYPLGRGE